MPNRNITLTDRHEKFVETLVSSGRFEGESDALRAGLELLEQSEKERELKLEMLSQAIEIGVKDLDEGRSIDLEDLDGLRHRMDAKLA